MSILIGGSPSTGSSLLRRMLNRHPEIFCGPESSLFAKQQLYDDWEGFKTKLFRKSLFGISNAGWHNFIGVELGEEYLWSKAEVKALVKASSSYKEFVSTFYDRILSETGKGQWAEKTPSNAFTMDLFLNSFREGKVIHIVRHPLDCIASLHLRGMTVYNAVCVYLLNTAKALASQEAINYHLIKYENLVTQPESTLEELCAFLKVPYFPLMLEPQKIEGGITSMKGWKSEETSKPNTASLGRFQEVEPLNQTRIKALVTLINQDVNPIYPHIRAIAAQLEYELPTLDKVPQDLRNSIEMEMKRDKQLRQFSNYYFKAKNYPIHLEV